MKTVDVMSLIKETIDRLYESSGKEKSKLLFYYEKLLSLLNNTKIFKSKFGIEPPFVRGVVAEILCETIAETFLLENGIEGKVVTNTLIDRRPDSSDKLTTELDVTMITDRGIFVFECKSFFGKLKTDGTSIISGNLSNAVTPWGQNMGHIKSLERNLQLYEDMGTCKYINIVFLFSIGKFVEWSPPENPDSYLLVPQGSLAELKRIYDSMDKCRKFDSNEITRIYNFMVSKTPTSEQMEEHIKMLQQYFK